MTRWLTICILAAWGWACAWGAAASDTQPSGSEEWRDLLDGNLRAWMSASGEKPSPGWVLEEGALVRRDRAGYIWTKERFGDFVLDLEFKTEGNSGVFFRTDDPRDCVQTGIEIQILPPVNTPSTHSCGAIYDCLAPSKEMTRPGAWNRLVVTAKDNRIAVVMNGEQIIDMDLDRWTEPGKNPDGSKNKFRAALRDFKRQGHIGLQDHGAAVSFRNVRVKSLDRPKP